MIQSFDITIADALNTYTHHIAYQVQQSIQSLSAMPPALETKLRLLVTGGGAFNNFLVKKINENLVSSNIEVIIAEDNIVLYKEALIMALLGILRWREENTVMATVTGALRSSIGGAVWIGLEA